MEVVNNKEGRPLEHYLGLYQAGEAAEMSARCGLTWDGEAFTIVFLGETSRAAHPGFAIEGPRELTDPERILFLRYLLDGQKAEPLGTFLTYRELPWGEVYLQQFTGRCIKRFAFSYGSCPEKLEKIMARPPERRRVGCGADAGADHPVPAVAGGRGVPAQRTDFVFR